MTIGQSLRAPVATVTKAMETIKLVHLKSNLGDIYEFASIMVFAFHDMMRTSLDVVWCYGLYAVPNLFYKYNQTIQKCHSTDLLRSHSPKPEGWSISDGQICAYVP